MFFFSFFSAVNVIQRFHNQHTEAWPNSFKNTGAHLLALARSLSYFCLLTWIVQNASQTHSIILIQCILTVSYKRFKIATVLVIYSLYAEKNWSNVCAICIRGKQEPKCQKLLYQKCAVCNSIRCIWSWWEHNREKEKKEGETKPESRGQQ